MQINVGPWVDHPAYRLVSAAEIRFQKSTTLADEEQCNHNYCAMEKQIEVNNQKFPRYDLAMGRAVELQLRT